MRVGLDTRAIKIGRGRGIGNYAIWSFRAMCEKMKSDYFILLTENGESYIQEIGDYPNLSEYVSEISQDMYKKEIYAEMLCKEYCKNCSIDIFYTANAMDFSFVPLKKSWFHKVKLTGTVHDAIQWRLPKRYMVNQNSVCTYQRFADNLSEYDLLFTISECSSKDIRELFSVDQIVVTYEGIFRLEEKIQSDENLFNPLISQIIRTKYIIIVGGIGASKNNENIIKAYRQYVHRTKEPLKLVIVCKLTDNVKRNIIFMLKQHPELKRQLIFTDYVSDEELSVLYQHAYWGAAISLYEGFGIPVLEAWSHGLPVLASNNSSLGEITADAALHVNPFDIDSISEGFSKIHNCSANERDLYIKRGKERLKMFEWNKVAKVFETEFRKICRH